MLKFLCHHYTCTIYKIHPYVKVGINFSNLIQYMVSHVSPFENLPFFVEFSS